MELGVFMLNSPWGAASQSVGAALSVSCGKRGCRACIGVVSGMAATASRPCSTITCNASSSPISLIGSG